MNLNSTPPRPLLDDDVVWVDANNPANDDQSKAEYTIGELARELALTLRALRFYESRGLIKPTRRGRTRVYTAADRDRIKLVLKGKKLGFTLTEIRDMIDAEAGLASAQSLRLSREKCLEQIAFFEKQMTDAKEALAELRQLHLALSNRTMGHGGK